MWPKGLFTLDALRFRRSLAQKNVSVVGWNPACREVGGHVGDSWRVGFDALECAGRERDAVRDTLAVA